MASKGSLQAENVSLANLKTNLRSCADRLYTSNNDASKIASILDKNYTLNNSSVAAVLSVNGLCDDIMDLRSRILDVYIPAIDDQISQNESDIREIERREAEEKKRKEEEERKRKEEEEKKRQEMAADKLRRQSIR